MLQTDPTMPVIQQVLDDGIVQERWELADCDPDDPKHKEQEILKDMALMRGTIMMLAGCAGRGKTSWMWALVFCFVLGREMFGIRPARPFRVVVIQGENEQWDIGRLRMQVLGSMGIKPGSEEWERVHRNVVVYKLQGVCGAGFARRLREIVMRESPDVVFIDPLLEYIGGDTNTSEHVGQWMRREVRPVLTQTNVACVLMHHTGKPPKTGNRVWSRHADLVYLSLGSVEFANVPRITFALVELEEEGLFALGVNKKAMELGWEDAAGKPTSVKWLRHSKERGSVLWHEVDVTEVRLKREGKKREAQDALEEAVPSNGGIRLVELLDILKENGVSARMSRRVVEEGIKDGMLAREMRQTGTMNQPQAWIKRRMAHV